MQTYLFQKSGPEDFHARMSRWHGWAREQGYEGAVLDFFMSSLESLAKDAPELFFSKTFMVSLAPTVEETLKSSYERWPNSGMLLDGVYLTAKISESHSHASESTLSDVIETHEVHPKYFLSPSAARGILRRTDRMKRNLFPPLRESLELLAVSDQ